MGREWYHRILACIHPESPIFGNHTPSHRVIWHLYRASKETCPGMEMPAELPFPQCCVWYQRATPIKRRSPQGQIAHVHRECRLQYGSTLDANFFGNNVISTTEPENLQAILASQFSSFGLSQWRHPQYRPLLGEGMFTSGGTAWEHSILRRSFCLEDAPTLFSPLIQARRGSRKNGSVKDKALRRPSITLNMFFSSVHWRSRILVY